MANKKSKKIKKRPKKTVTLDCYGLTTSSQVGKITFTSPNIPAWDGHW